MDLQSVGNRDVGIVGEGAYKRNELTANSPTSDKMGISYSDYDYDVLKKTVWLEARGEPHDGKVAVAQVIIGRALANRSYWGGNTIAGVCLHPYQFEPWNNAKPENTFPQGDGWEQMDDWMRDLLAGKIADPSRGALYFNNPDKEGYPDWTHNVRKGVKIGNHQFYNEESECFTSPHSGGAHGCCRGCTGQFRLKSHHNTFVRAHDGEWKADLVQGPPRAWENWYIEGRGDRVVLKSIHSPDRFLRAHPDGSVDLVDRPQEWETWEASKNEDGSWSLKSFHGGWLSARDDESLKTVGNRDAWEHFWLESW